MRILAHILLSALAVYVASRLLPGVHVQNFMTALVIAVVLGIVNATIRPVLFILTLPINLMTLGLLTFVIIGGCVELVAWMVPGFHIDGFLWALAFAAVLWPINTFLHTIQTR